MPEVPPVPCPCCHTDPEVTRHRCTRRWYARCHNLNCQLAPVGDSAETKEVAIANWNRKFGGPSAGGKP